LAWATTSASARIGSLTPVLECTQVTATTRVRSVIAAASALTIWSWLALAGSVYRRTSRSGAPERSAFNRSASWVA
jgi:hypothetical protein